LRIVLGAVVFAATLSAITGLVGRTLALPAVAWSPADARRGAALEEAQRRLSVPRETAAERHALLRRRTYEAGLHRRRRAADSSPYRFMVAPRADAIGGDGR